MRNKIVYASIVAVCIAAFAALFVTDPARARSSHAHDSSAWELSQVSRRDGHAWPMIRFVSGSAGWNESQCDLVRSQTTRDDAYAYWTCKRVLW